jgi:hypothetical protein
MHTTSAPVSAPTFDGDPTLDDDRDGAADQAADHAADQPPSPWDGDVAGSIPGLGAVLDALGRVDRAIAAAIDGLIELEDNRLVETVTQLPIEQWLSIAARRTRTDRRMLLTTTEVLRRLPVLRVAFCRSGELSWAQVRAIVLQVHRLPRGLDAALDEGIAHAIERCVGADPDAVIAEVGWVIAELQRQDPPSASPDASPTEEFLALQPRLDGTGGRMWGEFGPVGFATLDAALTARPDHGTRDRIGQAPDAARSRSVAASAGRARAQRLLDICDGHLAGRSSRGTGLTDPQPAPPVQLLVRADLDTLLDRDQTPAALLTHLSGGRMWVDAVTARRLVDERGADLRTVILDDTGAVVGVGRRRRTAPGWLRDALLARHDTCSAPGCLVAARVCDTDHARPWHPVRPDGRLGRSDVDQLAPLCRTDNRTKEDVGWTVTQHRDGRRTWRHTRTGLVTDTLPDGHPPPRSRGSPSRRLN